MNTFYQWLIETYEIPQTGMSSGKPAVFKKDAEIEEKYLTLAQILEEINNIPYYKEIIEDYDNKDYGWEVYKKAFEYATSFKEHPESIRNMPPIIVVDGKLQDGAHRISALHLVQKRLDKDNPFWKNVKLKVQFVKKSDLAKGDYHLS